MARAFCCNCRYWQRDEGKGCPLGTCHRRSPLPVFSAPLPIHMGGVRLPPPEYKTCWPVVDEYDWCGEFEEATKEDRDERSPR